MAKTMLAPACLPASLPPCQAAARWRMRNPKMPVNVQCASASFTELKLYGSRLAAPLPAPPCQPLCLPCAFCCGVCFIFLTNFYDVYGAMGQTFLPWYIKKRLLGTHNPWPCPYSLPPPQAVHILVCSAEWRNFCLCPPPSPPPPTW